jgi:hypothetical protein
VEKSEIDLVVDWAANELPTEEQDSLWKSNVAEAFVRCGLWDAAAENFRRALELDKTNWAACDGLYLIPHVCFRLGELENYGLMDSILPKPCFVSDGSNPS